MSHDKLAQLFDMQDALHRETVDFALKERPYLRESEVRIAICALALQTEIGELLNAYTAWQYWKSTGRPEQGRELIEDELADVWMFLIELSIELEYSADDIFRIIGRKNAIAHRRNHESI